MPQQNPFMNFNFGTSVNGQPNYDIGMTVDPGLMQQSNQVRQGLGSGGGHFTIGGGGNNPNAEAVTQQVQDDQLMSRQMDNMLASDSPYMARARQEGENIASRRGLMNSSMMGAASMGSAIDRAAPIAQFDANRFGSVADQNMQAENQAELANAQHAAQMNAAAAQGQGQFASQQMANQSRLDQMLAQHQFGALDDYRRHMLGLEDREDTQSFQGGQANIDRNINQQQFWGQQAPLQWAQHGLDQGRLGLANRQLDSQIYQGQYAPFYSTVASIYSNPNLTAEQQNAAVENMTGMMPGFAQQAWGSVPPGLFNPNAMQAAQGMPPMGPMNFGGGG